MIFQAKGKGTLIRHRLNTRFCLRIPLRIRLQNDMESCFSADCQETYNQTPVSFTFITPETENLFRPDDYPERFSRWFEKFVEHVTYNL